jgi:hypothetical protein
VHAGDRDLGGADEEEVVLGEAVGLLAATRELRVAIEGELFGEDGDLQRSEALARDAVQRELHQRELQEDGVALEDVAARAAHLRRALQVEPVLRLHQGDMVQRLEVEVWWLADALDLDVILLALPFRNRFVGDVGDEQPEVAQVCLQVALARLDFFEFGGEDTSALDGGLARGGVGSGFADRLRDFVLLRTQILGATLDDAQLGVGGQQRVDVHGGLAAARDVADQIGMLTNEGQVQHERFLSDEVAAMNCRRTMNAGLKSPLTIAQGFSPWRVLRRLRAEANPNKQYKAPPITKDERRAAWCHLHSSWPQQRATTLDAG